MLKNLQIHYVVKDEECEEKIKKEKFDDLTSEEKLNRVANIHTHGLEKYGFKNICTTIAYDMDYASWLLNSIANIIVEANGDFNFNDLHCFDQPDGKGGYEIAFYARFFEVKCYDEDCYIVVICNKYGFPLNEVDLIPELWNDDIIAQGDTIEKIERIYNQFNKVFYESNYNQLIEIVDGLNYKDTITLAKQYMMHINESECN